MTKDELIEKTDKTISELVYPKYKLLKAYNYYNGVRDKNLFKYLEETFGVSTPTSIHFTPLIRKHIDALVGEYLSMPLIPKVACKDAYTINNINREKLLSIAKEVQQYLKSNLKNSVLNLIAGKEMVDPLFEKQLKMLIEDLDTNFVSEYEIAALNVLEYIILSRDTDLFTNLRSLILDLLITGYTFYKVEPTVEQNNIRIRALDPLNTFIDRNPESPYVKNSHRAVVRTWMSKDQVLNKFGRDMTKEDRKVLEDKWQSVYDNSMQYVKMRNGSTTGILADIEVTPGYPSNQTGDLELIPVYEVEWIETDENYIMQRYETIRIGDEIYILKGLNENVIRTQSNPSYCTLSINGVFFLNRNSEPYSLVLACTHLQDLFDLLTFYRDNLIANSGTVGQWIDETLIPSHLGVNMPERIAKWITYKKQGIGLLNSAEEGRIASGAAPLNTIFNGYDDTVKGQAILAIQLAIEAIEQTTSSITGVFRERLNGIEAHDAVTNIKIGLNNSFIITKLYYHQMDLVVNELLLDSLNCGKIVFKNGLTGVLILGDKYLKTFTALPEYFTLTDYDIRILTSSDAVKDIEQVRLVIPEFVKSGSLLPDIILEAVTSKSLPDLKHKVKVAMLRAKEENNLMLLLAQKAQELELQLQQASKLLQLALQKIESLNEAKLLMESQKIQMEHQVNWYKAQTERLYKEAVAELDKVRTEIERALLFDGNPYNDKIRQISTS